MMDEMDSGSLFDHIDDLVGFPSDNGCGAGNELCATTAGGGCKDFPSIWGGDESLPDAYPLFPGINRIAASELSVQLSVPYEDIMHLEWLSTFMEDSFSCEGMTLSKNQISVVNNTSHDHFHISSPVSVLESSNNNSNSNNSSSASVVKYTSLTPTHQAPPHRARSKRPRPTTFNPRPMTQFILDQNPKKSKPKVPLSPALVEEKTDTQILRKCMHCEITKTPQWRAGPMGPKTLCNACGVRYKSGRLFPEYRPAASPTFVPSLHSNSRKKVEQMRNNVVLEKELDLTQ